MTLLAAILTAAAPAATLPESPTTTVHAMRGDYLTDYEKDFFQGKLSILDYYGSPFFIGNDPATENLRFWDRVDYEWIFFRNMPLSGYAILDDVLVDSWRSPAQTWYGQLYTSGIKKRNTPLGWRNMTLGLMDGLADGLHELFDAVKTVDSHFKLPPHPGCTTEGGTRFVAWVVNKGIVEPTRPVKPVYYVLHPVGWTADLVAKGFNTGYLMGIKFNKWAPPILAEVVIFGGYDLVTLREHRGEFVGKTLPFSFRSGCIGYMYEGDMNFRRGPEKAASKPPRNKDKETRILGLRMQLIP